MFLPIYSLTTVIMMCRDCGCPPSVFNGSFCFPILCQMKETVDVSHGDRRASETAVRLSRYLLIIQNPVGQSDTEDFMTD